MKWRLFLFLGLTAFPIGAPADSTINIPNTSELDGDDYVQAQQAKANKLYAAWKVEKDEAKRQAMMDELLEAAVSANDKEMVRRLARNGLTKKLKLPMNAKPFALHPLFSLPLGPAKDDANRYTHSVSPIFRRITRERIEAWTAREGWLFDRRGQLIVHVTVPRRDGTGREWFGAFLPSGEWMTTDLWNDDRQIYAFNPEGKWLWEREGRALAVGAPGMDGSIQDETPITWARSLRTGDGWIARLTFEDPVYLKIAPDGSAQLLNDDNPWKFTYPRAMQAKGSYVELSVLSDDAKSKFTQNSAGHGDWIDYPSYRVDEWPTNVTIPDGDVNFGFWPLSLRTWVETKSSETDLAGPESKEVWLLDAEGRYEAEVDGAWLGDSRDGTSLLLQDAAHRVVQLKADFAMDAREFQLAGTTAEPLALYDDLSLGFFYDANKSTVVLAGWK